MFYFEDGSKISRVGVGSTVDAAKAIRSHIESVISMGMCKIGEVNVCQNRTSFYSSKERGASPNPVA